MSNPFQSDRPSLAFVASDWSEAQEARQRLAIRYGEVPETEAEVVVALGGDGFMLEVLHRHMGSGRPIYGMNRGSVGFLMNDFEEADVVDRITNAEQAIIHPLCMTATDAEGRDHRALAINDVSLLRATRQAAKLRVLIDGRTRMDEL